MRCVPAAAVIAHNTRPKMRIPINMLHGAMYARDASADRAHVLAIVDGSTTAAG
jgi:hypothetical protein